MRTGSAVFLTIERTCSPAGFHRGHGNAELASCIRHEDTLFPQQCPDTASFTSTLTAQACNLLVWRITHLHNISFASHARPNHPYLQRYSVSLPKREKPRFKIHINDQFPIDDLRILRQRVLKISFPTKNEYFSEIYIYILKNLNSKKRALLPS